jgi:hypothetical protein
MNRLIAFPTALVALAGVLLAGCGGGGTTSAPLSPDGAAKPISVSGVVLEKDGETTDLAGIRLLYVEAGEIATTGVDGTFAFDAPRPGTVTLRVEMPSDPVLSAKNGADDGSAAGSDDSGSDDSGSDDAGTSSDDDGPDTDEDRAEDEVEDESGDDFQDDDEDEREESSDDGVRVEGVQDGESVRIRLRIENGQIIETRTSRSDRDEREVEIRMTRATTNDDADMKGEVELESRTDREKFEVEVEHAAPDRELELFVIDPDGIEESQGVRFVDAFGEAEWEFETNDGDRLPFDVATVDDLVDHTVEVRDATSGVLLLTTELGELPASAPSTDDGSRDDDSGSDGGNGEGDRVRGRARLTAAESGLDGYVEVRRRADENRERFQIEAEHLAPGRVVELFVEDPGMAGSLLSLGRFAADSAGEVELELDTNDGDMLPGNVATVLDLVGLEVQVRDGAGGGLLLSGLVPTPVLDD